MMNKLFKSVALALAAITLSLPLSTQAFAAGRHDGPAHNQIERRDNHRPQPIQAHRPNANQHRVIPARDTHKTPPRVIVHRDAPRYEHVRPVRHEGYRPAPPDRRHNSKTDKFVTGAIIGAVIGAIIANNS